jgi:hypothetical protein
VLEYLEGSGIKGWPVPLVNPVLRTDAAEAEADDEAQSAYQLPTMEQMKTEHVYENTPAAPEPEPSGEAYAEAEGGGGHYVNAGDLRPVEAESKEGDADVYDTMAHDQERSGADAEHAEEVAAEEEEPPKSESAAGAASSKRITAPTIAVAPERQPEKKVEVTKQRMSRAEKQAMLEKEEAEREERIEEALKRPAGSIKPIDLHEAKDHEKYEEFRKQQVPNSFLGVDFCLQQH